MSDRRISDHVMLPAHRTGLPGKEVIRFLLRPFIPPARRGLWEALPVNASWLSRFFSDDEAVAAFFRQ